MEQQITEQITEKIYPSAPVLRNQNLVIDEKKINTIIFYIEKYNNKSINITELNLLKNHLNDLARYFRDQNGNIIYQKFTFLSDSDNRFLAEFLYIYEKNNFNLNGNHVSQNTNQNIYPKVPETDNQEILPNTIAALLE